ncbi:MFS transporter [Demequina mangrovi]|uniref:Predicted arabinose efflux permease, MFS family n=1 Tax=Demequina mangrovi TaxID=1043493 RepID=A0A1H6WGY0_9MICO|nr:MFS transporter [Demequina mangrovi]SEJ14966.1 Predicted arabinose efflux permease, MFS family [Demequina mangrovi]
MTHAAARVTSAHRGVLAIQWILGFYMATVSSRLPTITELLGVTTGELARLMLFGALGALCAMLVTGWSVARFGTYALLGWSAFLHLVAISAVGVSTAWGSQVLFAAANFFVAFAFATANVCVNAEAAEVERAIGRAVMPQFHAGFSVGLASGLAVGAWLSHVGVAPVWHFSAVALMLTVLRLSVRRVAVLDGSPRPDDARPGLGGPFAAAREEYRDRRVVLIGLIVFTAAAVEGAAGQWTSLAVVQAFGQTEAVGDLFYWLFVVSMVTVRWWGAPIIARLGRVVTLRVSAVLVATGLTLFAFTPTLALVPLAMVLWGLGAALTVPIGFSAASDDPRHAAARVAAVSSFMTIAGLTMPQIIGHLGDVVQLRVALMVVVIGTVISFTLARAVRAEGPLFRSHRALARREDAVALGPEQGVAGAAVAEIADVTEGGDAAADAECACPDRG